MLLLLTFPALALADCCPIVGLSPCVDPDTHAGFPGYSVFPCGIETQICGIAYNACSNCVWTEQNEPVSSTFPNLFFTMEGCLTGYVSIATYDEVVAFPGQQHGYGSYVVCGNSATSTVPFRFVITCGDLTGADCSSSGSVAEVNMLVTGCTNDVNYCSLTTNLCTNCVYSIASGDGLPDGLTLTPVGCVTGQMTCASRSGIYTNLILIACTSAATSTVLIVDSTCDALNTNDFPGGISIACSNDVSICGFASNACAACVWTNLTPLPPRLVFTPEGCLTGQSDTAFTPSNIVLEVTCGTVTNTRSFFLSASCGSILGTNCSSAGFTEATNSVSVSCTGPVSYCAMATNVCTNCTWSTIGSFGPTGLVLTATGCLTGTPDNAACACIYTNLVHVSCVSGSTNSVLIVDYSCNPSGVYYLAEAPTNLTIGACIGPHASFSQVWTGQFGVFCNLVQPTVYTWTISTNQSDSSKYRAWNPTNGVAIPYGNPSCIYNNNDTRLQIEFARGPNCIRRMYLWGADGFGGRSLMWQGEVAGGGLPTGAYSRVAGCSTNLPVLHIQR